MTTFYERRGKRLLDVVLGSAAAFVAGPVLAVTAGAIALEDGRPVLFRQRRLGQDEREFVILKFRSMTTDTPNMPSDQIGTPTVTRVGKVIRRLNVDELPQLFNIIGGDMSIVGPRPALASQVEVVRKRVTNGASVLRPGLTGLAQVNSFDGMSAEEKARFDGEYAQRVSFARDALIIARTFVYLLKPPPTY